MRHRHDEALALAERSVALHQIARLGTWSRRRARHARTDLRAARRPRTRRADPHPHARSPQSDSVPRDDRRGVRHARADSSDARLVRARRRVSASRQRCLRRVRHADDALVRVVAQGARRQARDQTTARTTKRSRWPTSSRRRRASRRPMRFRPTSPACEALVAAGRIDDAEHRLETCEARLDPQDHAGELGRVSAHSRSSFTSSGGRPQPRITTSRRARTSSSCSASAIRRRSASWRSADSPHAGGSRSAAERYLDSATTVFKTLGAQRDLDEAGAARDLLSRTLGDAPLPIFAPTPTRPSSADWWTPRSSRSLLRARRRLPCSRATDADAAVIFVESPTATCASSPARDAIARWRTLARAAHHGSREYRRWTAARSNRSGKEHDGPRRCVVVACRQPMGDAEMRRFRMFAAVARQGFELCGVRDRPVRPGERPASDRSSRCCPASSAPARR